MTSLWKDIDPFIQAALAHESLSLDSLLDSETTQAPRRETTLSPPNEAQQRFPGAGVTQSGTPLDHSPEASSTAKNVVFTEENNVNIQLGANTEIAAASETYEDGAKAHSIGEDRRKPQIHSEDAARVEELKLRYIVGKVAGKDLHDGSGRVIVQRGEGISKSVVAAAEEAGKLVELIVNMVIADFSE